MNKAIVIISLIVLVVWIGGIGFAVMKDYEMNRDVLSWKDRAQVAANAPDMLGYIKTMRSSMENHGMTEGQCAVIFGTPATDMGKNYQAVLKIEERLQIIDNMDESSQAYQSGTDDVRGIIRELNFSATEWWFVNRCPIPCGLFILFIGLGWISIATMVWGLMKEDSW